MLSHVRVGEGAHPWVGGLLGFPCLSLGPPAGAPKTDIDVVYRVYEKRLSFLGTALPLKGNVCRAVPKKLNLFSYTR